MAQLGRHLVGAQHYRDLRASALSEWSSALALDQATDFSGLNKLSCQSLKNETSADTRADGVFFC